jgi:hypothetical protein
MKGLVLSTFASAKAALKDKQGKLKQPQAIFDLQFKS